MRALCGCRLVKTVELASKKRVLYPYMTYCYLSIECSIQALFNRSAFPVECEKWRSRQIPSGLYEDVYDGKVWKEFLVYEGKPFLSDAHNLALMMNMDFFQPYKHVKYSVGAIYLTVLNLPRALRYKQDNIILVGLIPGPHEPETHINSFLDPLVNELLHFWDGIDLAICSVAEHKCVRCALLCLSCDIPGGRKTCGFLSHSAHYGCSRCLKFFPGSGGVVDYSGFDRENWVLRTGSSHREAAMRLRNFTTKIERTKCESQSGCRYSVLLKLPYFDAPRMLIVDPMHNLFLGTAKHILKAVWIEKGIISDDSFDLIQSRVNSALTASGIGRIPYKITSGFASFTADQWKNWVNYFSLLALHDILKGDDLECWRHFVLACRLLTRKEVTANQIIIADTLLLQFCKRAERMYGKSVVTPNMHMHCHLRSCMEDYGPSHGFWLFAFERCNGILGSMPNNNRSAEVQLMNRFVADNMLASIELPHEYSEDLRSYFTSTKIVGSVADTIAPHVSTQSGWTVTGDISLPSYRSRYVLRETQVREITELISKLYSTPCSSVLVGTVAWMYQYKGKQLGSSKSRSRSSSIVLASWKSNLFGEPLLTCSDLEGPCPPELDRAAVINRFLLHTISVCNETKTFLFVSLSWHQCHPKMLKIGKPVTVWCRNIFETGGLHSIVPIQCITSRTVSLEINLDGECVLAVCPCVEW